MSLIVRIALPAAMLVVLIYTLNAAARELRAWNARLETPNRKVVPNIDAEPVTFTIYPVQHGDRIQDVIALQWPAFLVAGTVAPVPRLSYSERRPKVLSWASYVTLPLAVGLYWFAIAVWIDKRLIQRKRPIHSTVVRLTMTLGFGLMGLLFLLFLGKDLLSGWPEGPQGAYGLTAWLATICIILWTEVNGLRRKASTTPEL